MGFDREEQAAYNSHCTEYLNGLATRRQRQPAVAVDTSRVTGTAGPLDETRRPQVDGIEANR